MYTGNTVLCGLRSFHHSPAVYMCLQKKKRQASRSGSYGGCDSNSKVQFAEAFNGVGGNVRTGVILQHFDIFRPESSSLWLNDRFQLIQKHFSIPESVHSCVPLIAAFQNWPLCIPKSVNITSLADGSVCNFLFTGDARYSGVSSSALTMSLKKASPSLR
jgi:hypothetical protein